MSTQPSRPYRFLRLGAVIIPLLMTAACSSLLPAGQPAPNFYSLDYAPAAASVVSGITKVANADAPTLIVTPPRGAPAFDRPRIVYLKLPHKVEYYAENQWVDTPARMIAPLIVSALERGGAFRAVLQTPGVAIGQVRLDTEILRLQQEFFTAPSQLRFTLRARLIDDATRVVLATREFEALVNAPSENPYGGVQAANQAVGKVLDELVVFCAETTRSIKAPMANK